MSLVENDLPGLAAGGLRAGLNPSPPVAPQPRLVVMGLGNRLLGDDAMGPMVIDALREPWPEADDSYAPHLTAIQWPSRAASPRWSEVRLIDGGTIGLALLHEIVDADALIAVDAAELGAPAGTVRIFEAEAMDGLLGGCRRSAHEVALSDLMAAAALAGALPARRALVAVQPASTGLNLQPTRAVADALPRLCEAVGQLATRWAQPAANPLKGDSPCAACRP